MLFDPPDAAVEVDGPEAALPPETAEALEVCEGLATCAEEAPGDSASWTKRPHDGVVHHVGDESCQLGFVYYFSTGDVIGARCFRHDNCHIMRSAAKVPEDQMVQWLIDGHAIPSAIDEHGVDQGKAAHKNLFGSDGPEAAS